MTVRRSKGRKRRICCDGGGCKAEFGPPFDKDHLIQIVGQARQAGWYVHRDHLDIWRHECPAHKDGGAREKRPAPMGGAPGQRFRADIDG